MTCQWTELEGCYEDCSVEGYSPGLWRESDEAPCIGTRLEVSLASEYYVASEYLQGVGVHSHWIYSDHDLYGVVSGVISSTVSGEEYANEISWETIFPPYGLPTNGGELGEYPYIAFGATDDNLVTPFTFTVFAIQLKDAPKRTFEPINCFVLGASQCI